jgi:hypothetical protein
MNSGACSTVHTFYSLQEVAPGCFLETCGTPQLQVGPTKKKLIFLPYQTLIVVDAGEPHPQPQHQTPTK